jgi:hypothetical protein
MSCPLVVIPTVTVRAAALRVVAGLRRGRRTGEGRRARSVEAGKADVDALRAILSVEALRALCRYRD